MATIQAQLEGCFDSVVDAFVYVDMDGNGSITKVEFAAGTWPCKCYVQQGEAKRKITRYMRTHSILRDTDIGQGNCYRLKWCLDLQACNG